MASMIVLDTSVVVSALIGKQGPSRSLIRHCLLGRYVPLISNALFEEIEDVTSRASILKQCPLSAGEIRELLNALYSVCRWVPIYYLWRPNLSDEGDNFLIELAIAGNGEYIVTNNIRDLSGAELSFPEFSVVTPEQLLRGEH